jgi:hypothetical protein
MVDLAVLEAAAERRGSSSLPIRTNNCRKAPKLSLTDGV